jgi:hypothetical protein
VDDLSGSRYRGVSMTHFDGGRHATRSRHSRTRPVVAVALAAVIVLGACGGGDDDSATSTGDDTGDSPAANTEGGSTTPPEAVQHFDSDLAQVCRGTGVDWATPYDPARTGPHKVVVFQGPVETDMTALSTGNAEWDVLFDEASDAYAAVELVACAVRTADELTQTCTGYTDDDGTDSGKTVEYHSATYTVTLRDATTAAVIDETTIEAEADVCPMLVYFDEGETTATQYASVDANEFLLPHATT